jgi:hypothetical protein
MILAFSLAHASPLTVNFTSDDPLAGWTARDAGGTTTFEDGFARIETDGTGSATWWVFLDRADSPWFGARSANGWWVEADLVVTADCPTAYLQAGDDVQRWIVRLGDGTLTVLGSDEHESDLDTSVLHTIGVYAHPDGLADVRVDGVPLFEDLMGRSVRSGGVGFGNDGCPGTSDWYGLRFDTFEEGRGGEDDDGDGVVNDLDDCPGDADPDQQDADGDGGGDLCDPCPADADDRCLDSGGETGIVDTGDLVIPGPDHDGCELDLACVHTDGCCGGSGVAVVLPIGLLFFTGRNRSRARSSSSGASPPG